MASGGLILSADIAGDIIDNAQETAFEVYSREAGDNPIPELFEVRPIERMNHGLYHITNLRVTDSILEEREMGEALTDGSEGERRFVICKRRFFEKSYHIPDELVRYAMLGGGNARQGIEGWIRERSEVWAQGRFWAEQTHAAGFFNNGGLTAGSPEFDNSVPGVIADSGADLMFDGIELFNLTGNARTALSGDTYFNTVALALTATNFETLVERVEATNNRSELGERFTNTANVLLVSPDQRSEAERIVLSDKLAGSANNDMNPWTRFDVVVWGHLTDTDAWFVGKRRAGLLWFQGGEPDIKIEQKGRVISVSMQAEFGACATEWRHWGASQVSAS